MRIIDTPHPRLGTKNRVYPLYDFAVSLEDANVTHVLRSEEFLPKISLQNMIRDYLNLPNPEFVHFSRLKIKNTPVQKRVIRELIEKKIISSWDDPRISTINGLRSRGIVPETLSELVYELRLSTSKGEMDWNIILALNRKILDPKARRFFAVIDPIKLTIQDLEPNIIELKNHPVDKTFGTRKIETENSFWINSSDLQAIKDNPVIRLKDFLNVDILKVAKKEIIGRKSTETSHEVPKIQWVPENSSIPLELRTINDLYESVDEQIINPNSMIKSYGFVEKNINDLNVYDVLQLERIGFACLQQKSKQIILNLT
jgi:glutamyl-tRNA synthetase